LYGIAQSKLKAYACKKTEIHIKTTMIKDDPSDNGD
jgi:hypothetical protein